MPTSHTAMRVAKVQDTVEAERDPGSRRIESSLVALIPELTLGLVRARRGALWLGPLPMIRFGRAASVPGGWRWPVIGGLLVRRPGGSIELVWEEGRLESRVEGYAPSLPWPLYTALQRPLHHLLMRSLLLRLRGSSPAPGVPAEPARRVLAAAIDVALCGAIALPARRRLLTFTAIATGYHLGCWVLGGKTAGGWIVGERVVSADGGRLTSGQALLRLAHLPRAVLRLRALHDQAAGTEVVLD